MILSEPEGPIGAEGGKAGRIERNRPLRLKMLTFPSHCAGSSPIRGGSVCPLGDIEVNNKPCGAAGNEVLNPAGSDPPEATGKAK